MLSPDATVGMTGLQTQIERLRGAIWRGQREIDACFYDNTGNLKDVGEIDAIETCCYWFDKLKRKQQVRKDQLERLLKKEARNGKARDH